MKNKTLAIILFSILFLACGWTYTFDISTPASSDDPREAPTRFQEIKKSIQEREDVDHYWPLTGNEVSDACSGEHRKLTLQGINAVELAALTSAKSYVYRYGRELYYKDANGTGDTYTTQITKLGKLNLDDSRLSNNTYLVGRNVAGSANINIIKVNDSNTLTLGAIATLPDGSKLATSAAPAADAQIANKKYVDDRVAAKVFGAWPTVTTVTTTVAQGATNTDVAATLAATDGFLVAKVTGSSGQVSCALFGYTDSANPPTTLRCADSIGQQDKANIFYAGYTMPVKKGDYYKATWYGISGNNGAGERTYYFLPASN